MAFNGFYDNFKQYGSLKGNLGDYQHASRLYVANNMRLAPKFKHLYHVVLNINPSITTSGLSNDRRLEINLLARSADLPKYRLQTETVNQYNRKKVLHTSVQYQPVVIEFHDDNAGLTTRLWENYFRYYYADSNYSTTDGFSPSVMEDAYRRSTSGLNKIYSTSEQQQYRYGLDTPNKVANFFSSIQVFQLHPHNRSSTYTSFTLINPYIENFEHDQMSQESSEFSLNRLSVAFESVQYSRGNVMLDTAPAGFGTTHYDNTPSNLGTGNLSGGIFDGIRSAVNTINDVAETLSAIENLSKIFSTTSSTGNITTNTLGNLSFPSSSSSANSTEATQRKF